MKITYSSENINTFGGINFADSIIGNASVYKTIDQTLGQRGIKAGYSCSDLIRSYLLMVLCCGECAEDITEHLRSELSQIKGTMRYWANMGSKSNIAVWIAGHLTRRLSRWLNPTANISTSGHNGAPTFMILSGICQVGKKNNRVQRISGGIY